MKGGRMIAPFDVYVDSMERVVSGDDPRAARLIARQGKQVPAAFVDKVKKADKPVKPVKDAKPDVTKETRPVRKKSGK